MADVPALTAEQVGFMEAYMPPDVAVTARPESRSNVVAPSFVAQMEKEKERDGALPFVTLTYASSLDGMIASAPGARTTLSGPETKSMTHYLRKRHDAILVGAGTAVTDNPGLNCRYPGATIDDQPRPVIVDPNGRYTIPGKKAYDIFHDGDGKEPWIVTHTVDYDDDDDRECQVDLHHRISRKATPDNAIPRPNIPWQCILEELKKKGINSVMIEGGAAVINSLLALPSLVDRVVITVAPTHLGSGGVSVAPRRPSIPSNGPLTNITQYDDVLWKQFGKDVVMFSKPRRPPVYK